MCAVPQRVSEFGDPHLCARAKVTVLRHTRRIIVHTRAKLGYMLLGGMNGVLGLAVALCVSPLQAGHKMTDVEFEKITRTAECD